MEFFTISHEKRPVRLCETTRKFAWDSLNHMYGKDTAKTPGINMDDVEGFAALNLIGKYDLAIRRIAESAPIRICPNEKLSGAATLGLAINHVVPVTFEGDTPLSSISHLTVDFETVLKRGINGIEDDVRSSFKLHTEEREVRFLESCLSVIESFKLWHERYLVALKDMPGYENNYRNLKHVPFEPAQNFYEAVQSVWFTFAFIRLCGNWPGIGRIDWLLGDYLKKDLLNGILTIEEAREILAHFFIKGCEWVMGGDYGSGDAQHYQNIVLAGSDGQGGDVTNEVTYLVLDIIEELGISDFPTTVRLSRNTDEKLLTRVSEVLRFGGGILAFYNEELIIKSLVDYGYSPDVAWKFANDGCWEIQIPGETFFCYIPFDSLQILEKPTLDAYSGNVIYDDFESLFQQYLKELSEAVYNIARGQSKSFEKTPGHPEKWRKEPDEACTVVSVFERGCIEKALSYIEGGPHYNVISPHIGGFPDTVNALYAIKKMVFDEHRVTFAEFMKILSNDWEGYEDLRRVALNEYAYYGNDNDEVDEIASRILDAFAKACAEYESMLHGFYFPAGVSTFGRQLEWAPYRLAAPHGHKKGEVLAPNCSPTPGSDREGATAIIKSYCKADLSKMVTGAALDLKLLPTSVEGDDGIAAITAILRGFVMLGGCFIQPDVEDKEILKLAQEHPENYQTLSVRVSGWNARFVTLCKEWQDMIIDENK